jgi:hypothetical protein
MYYKYIKKRVSTIILVCQLSQFFSSQERSRVNRSLAMIRRERLEAKSPLKVPVEMKTG